jgi:glutathione-regulated potassium-efflux system protein KefB
LPHIEIDSLLATTIGLLGLIVVCLLLFGRLGIGSIVAFLVAGLIAAQFRAISGHTLVSLREIAEIGVVLLLFLIGLEITPPQLRGLSRNALTYGLPQIVVSVAAIALYMEWRLIGHPEVGGWEAGIVLGLGFAMSSTIVVVQLLKDRGELHSSWGRPAFAILLAQDLAIVPFLLIVSLMAKGEADGGLDTPWLWAAARAVAVIAAIPLIGRFVLMRVLALAERQQNTPAFVCSSFIGVLAAALAAEQAGLSMALGTFLLGATLSTSKYGHQIAEAIEPVKSVLLALFFLSVGLSIDLDVIGHAWAALIINTTAILVIKAAIIFIIASTLAAPRHDATLLALALAPCGEFGFVLFVAAQQGGLISPDLSALGSVLIAISMVATPFLVRLGDKLTGAPTSPVEENP